MKLDYLNAINLRRWESGELIYEDIVYSFVRLSEDILDSRIPLSEKKEALRRLRHGGGTPSCGVKISIYTACWRRGEDSKIFSMRLIAANWKMHKTVSETEEYILRFLELLGDVSDREVLLCPPFTALHRAGELLRDTPVRLGAQNCHYEKSGAFTGEVSPVMLREIGCSFVIVGHSERRHIFGENDELINRKLVACLEEGLRPILCVGEKLEEREAGMTFKVVETQLRLALSGIEEHTDRIDIAYEPVWAIGTGVPATPEDAVSVHRFIGEIQTPAIS